MKKAAVLILTFLILMTAACSQQKVINGEKMYSAIQNSIGTQTDSAAIASSVAAVCPLYEFGGIYIDENDCVVVLILDITTDQSIFVSNDKIRFQICSYSYGELRDLQETLNKRADQLSLVSASVSMQENRVIAVQNISTSSDEYLRQLNEQDASLLQDPRVEIRFTARGDPG